MSTGRIVDRAFRLYRGNFLRFVTIVAVVHVPVFLISMGLAFMWADAAKGSGGQGPSLAGIAPTIVAVIVGVCAQALCSAALVKSISESYLGNAVTVGEAYRFVLPKLLTLIGASLLVGLVCGLGFLLFVVPGVIFSLWFALTSQAIVIEDVGATGGMSRSKQLAKGNLGKIFVVGLIVFLISLLINQGLAFAVRPLQPAPPDGSGTTAIFLAQGAGLIAGILVAPVSAAAFILLYYDIRIRKEGFDLEMLAQRLGSAAPPAAPGVPSQGTSADPTPPPVPDVDRPDQS